MILIQIVIWLLVIRIVIGVLTELFTDIHWYRNNTRDIKKIDSRFRGTELGQMQEYNAARTYLLRHKPESNQKIEYQRAVIRYLNLYLSTLPYYEEETSYFKTLIDYATLYPYKNKQ
jgi:hypothetical protein